jgi:hypothetical protein
MIGMRPRVADARSVGRRAAFAALMVATAWTGCSHETGPSLSIEVENAVLAPSSSIANAASICCCRVRGTVRNTSSITVDVNINFDSQGAAGGLGTAIDWVRNLESGAQASFDAPGIIAPCEQVTAITGRHRITGVFTGSGGS